MHRTPQTEHRSIPDFEPSVERSKRRMGLFAGVEEHPVEAGARRGFGFFKRMGVIGVEKDFERSFLAQALHNRRGLASTEEFAFALRGTEDYRQAQLGGGVGHRLADGEFGEVEVADSSALSVAMSEDFRESAHGSGDQEEMSASGGARRQQVRQGPGRGL